jgi:N-acetylmuramic acid 6-phosphate etherase
MTQNNPISNHPDLGTMPIDDLLKSINQEDAKVHVAVERTIPQLTLLVEAILPRMMKGGRLFYIGAGTSGRLGVLDASEIPPTFGLPENIVIGIIAGGDTALRRAVENAEDDDAQAWLDLSTHNITPLDTVIGIAASGSTPYVVGGVRDAKRNGALTGGITCTPNSTIAKEVDFAIEADTGPEFIMGSTRLKAGTAQKMILNMLTTTLMVKLGRTQGNKMLYMQLTNKKLVKRGTQMVMEELGIPQNEAQELLLRHKSVALAIRAYKADR